MCACSRRIHSLQAIQRRPITASHNFSNQGIRNGMGAPCQPTAPMNGRTRMASPLWNSQSQMIGSQTNLSLQPSHMQQQQSSTSWNSASMPHGFPATSYVHFALVSTRTRHGVSLDLVVLFHHSTIPWAMATRRTITQVKH